MFRNRKKDKYICPLICHQYVLHINVFIFFETITVHVHGLLCGEIQISGEFEYKHYRGAIKGFSGFQNKFDCRHRAQEMYVQEKIYLCKINLIVHFLSSMSTNKVALNLQTSLIALPNKDPFCALVAMLYKREIFCDRHNCSPRLFLIERSHYQQTSYKVR